MSLFGDQAGDAGEPDWRAHEARAGHLAADAPAYDGFGGTGWPGGREERELWLAAVLAQPPEVAASLLVLLIRKATAEGGWDRDTSENVRQILKRLSFTPPASDAAYALRAAMAMPDWFFCREAIVAATALAARCEDRADPGLQMAARDMAVDLDRRKSLYADRTSRARKNLLKLRIEPAADQPLDTSRMIHGDGWSAAVLPQLARWPSPTGQASQLLRHLESASGSKPAKSWLSAASGLLTDSGSPAALRALVECAATAEPVPVPTPFGFTAPIVVAVGNSDLVRAACWAASCAAGEDWTVPALTTIVHRADNMASVKVPNAAIFSLGQIATPAAISALLQLQRTIKHAGYRKQITAAIAVAAQNAGLSPGQLTERAVADAGLSASGDRLITSGAVVARVSITPDWKAQAQWQAADGWARKAPAEADAQTASAVRRTMGEVRAALADERARLEGLLAEDRAWDGGEWHKYYLDHPVTGRLARGLIWEFTDGSERLAGIPADGDLLDTPSRHRQLPSAATVRLWHPVRAATSEVQQWRDHLVATGLRQPFKQAFREVYLLTPAERETRLYSNRFAAHILRYRQVYALFKERGWTSNFLGPYDGGYEGLARRDFPDAGLTAVFAHFQADADQGAMQVLLCSTDRVSFSRIGDRRHTPIPLEEVPELTFAEAMRDVDLFVSVTSIALDPRWADRGDDPHLAYWHQYSFGELSQTAAIRRDALARILPKLKIAPRLELTDRHVRVKGNLNNYKIHIGSGNILIEPDDRYLCIVAHGSAPKVMLPFEGDQVLTFVLSKAVLLAADDKITDPTILRQLRNR